MYLNFLSSLSETLLHPYPFPNYFHLHCYHGLLPVLLTYTYLLKAYCVLGTVLQRQVIPILKVVTVK